MIIEINRERIIHDQYNTQNLYYDTDTRYEIKDFDLNRLNYI